MNSYVMNTPMGLLKITGDASGLFSVKFIDGEFEAQSVIPDTLTNPVHQLKEYFNRTRKTFDLKLNPEGTEFQKKVWQELQEIPYGKTKTYQQMAKSLGDPKVIRAAASANGKNPIAIIIPCHRVIGSDGSLTGYAGGLERKKWLLAHESPVKQGELF